MCASLHMSISLPSREGPACLAFDHSLRRCGGGGGRQFSWSSPSGPLLNDTHGGASFFLFLWLQFSYRDHLTLAVRQGALWEQLWAGLEQAYFIRCETGSHHVTMPGLELTTVIHFPLLLGFWD